MTLLKPQSLLPAVLILFLAHVSAFGAGSKPLTKETANTVTIELINTSKATLIKPAGLTLSPEGLYLLMADQGAGVIRVFDPGRLKLLSEFGGGELTSPTQVMFGKKGELLVMDSGQNNAVVRYRFEGVYRDGSANAQRLGMAEKDIVFPKREFVDENSKIWQVDSAAHQVKVFGPAREPLGFFGNGKAGTGPGQLNAPGAVTVAGRYVWVSDTGNKRVLLLKHK